MKTTNSAFFVFFLLNVAVGLSCYFYPVTRDEFYYLDGYRNPFSEYYKAYFFGNPRLGQFFTNIISRNWILEIIFGLLLFNGFFSVVYLNIYRRLPNFRNAKDLTKYLVVAAFFIFLINYFGEMFFYTPFSGNYTFTHVFYLFFVFLFTEYYVFGREECLNGIRYFLLIIFGFMVGMFNEHVPPVLLMLSFFGAAYCFIKNKKFPNFRFMVLPISIFIGYLFLFFAPANLIKERDVGKSVFDTSLHSYFENMGTILKYFFYYNVELVVITIVTVIFTIIFRKRIFSNQIFIREFLVYLAFAILPLLVVGVSPLIGTRLLFFSTSIVIIIMMLLWKQFVLGVQCRKVAVLASFLFLPSFLAISVYATMIARKNYQSVITEIENKSKVSKDVKLQKSFNYFAPQSNYLNRKIFLESGSSYIDRDSSKNTSVENILIHHYHLKSLQIR